MRKIFAVALICVGTPLELYFYWYRFTNEGMAGPIAIVAGIGLVMLLSILVYFLERNRKNIGLLIAVIFLSAFDVISTSAGQSFATLSVTLANQGIEAKNADAEWRIKDAEAVIARLDKEYEALLLQESSVASIEDRAKWRTAMAGIEASKSRISRERAEALSSKESALTVLNAVSSERKLNIYSYYESLFKLPAKWIQFVLHTILSVGLSCMTPVGVILFGLKDSELGIETSKATRHRKSTSASPEELVKEVEETVARIEELPEIANPREIGKALGLSHVPVYNAIKDGKLTPISMNPVRVARDEVARWYRDRNAVDVEQ